MKLPQGQPVPLDTLVASTIDTIVSDILNEDFVGTDELSQARETLLDEYCDGPDPAAAISQSLAGQVRILEDGIRLDWCSEGDGYQESLYLLAQRFAPLGADPRSWITCTVEDSKSPTEVTRLAVLASGEIVAEDAV